jgi:UMF1 family MFS transporter
LTEQVLRKNNRKTIHGWAMYDWANSVYSLVISSAIFPAYYNQVTRQGGSGRVNFLGFDVENTAIYSICLGLSFGIVAFISPLLSSISDYSGSQRSFMRFFCYIGAAACAMLFFFVGSNLLFGLAGLMAATVGYAGSIVFYNAYLPAIATEDRRDHVSARGYAYGYVGSVLLLVVCLAAIINQEALGIRDDTFLPRLSFLLVGCWWFLFAQITFRRLPKGIYRKRPEGHYLLNGYRELGKVWRRLRHELRLKTFLLAFFFYIMGVQTVMFMAASFGEKEVHLGFEQLIITVLTLEVIAIAGAYLFAWLSGRYGNIHALIIAVLVWVGICIGAYFIKTAYHFYAAGFFIGMVMGGIQSLSRSTYSKLIPLTDNNAGYFSFFDVCEKVAMMLGLVSFGYLDNLTGSMRNSIIALGMWFVLGLVFLVRLRYNSGSADFLKTSA